MFSKLVVSGYYAESGVWVCVYVGVCVCVCVNFLSNVWLHNTVMSHLVFNNPIDPCSVLLLCVGTFLMPRIRTYSVSLIHMYRLSDQTPWEPNYADKRDMTVCNWRLDLVSLKQNKHATPVYGSYMTNFS